MSDIIIQYSETGAMICDGVQLGSQWVKEPGGKIYHEPPQEPDPLRALNVCRSWCSHNGIVPTAEVKL